MNDWYVCFYYFGKIVEISHTCVENWYVCTHGFGVCFVLQTNKAVAISWLQPQPQLPKVAISIYVIEWKLLFHSTILFSSFPRAFNSKFIIFKKCNMYIDSMSFI